MTIITSVPSGTYSLEKALKHLQMCRSLPQGCVLNHDGLIMQHFLISSAYKAYHFLDILYRYIKAMGTKIAKLMRYVVYNKLQLTNKIKKTNDGSERLLTNRK